MKFAIASRLGAGIAVLALAACGSSTTTDGTSSAEPRSAISLPDGNLCTPMAATDAVVTSGSKDPCQGCGVTDAELAADDDMESAATLTLTAAAGGGGVALRVARTASTFPAGQRAGIYMDIGRTASVGANPVLRLRTYLADVLQEELSLTGATNGINNAVGSPGAQMFAMDTGKAFDAIEFAIESTAVAGDFSVAVFEACSEVVGPTAVVAEDTSRQKRPMAVVADLSTGANPYHRVFRRPNWTQHPSKLIPGFPADAPALELSLDARLADAVEQDRQKWLDLPKGVVHWIPGTNLLYVRTRHADEAFPGADHDRLPYTTTNHGSLTSGVIADACPDCYLLIVADPEGGFTYSMNWLGENAPWVDTAASTQHATTVTPQALGAVAESFVVSPVLGPGSEYASAAKRWAQSGKFYFVASGNTPISATGYPVPIPTTDRSLPPWFTVIGGAYAECRGEEVMAGKPNEFVSEYVARAPAYDSIDDYMTVSGTSFSTPLVATRFAQAVRYVREALGDTREPGAYWAGKAQKDSPYLADGKLTRDELYQAFAQAADLFAADEYTGPCGSNSAAVSSQPWLQMGWGYVGADQTALAADLLLGRAVAPVKPAGQAEYMDAYLGAREAAGSVTP
jgi:hypothetical protein